MPVVFVRHRGERAIPTILESSLQYHQYVTADTIGVVEPEPDAMDVRILDGALDAVGRYGIKRASIDDIAAAAQVGRATVFRRFGSKDAVMQRMAEREVRRLTDTINQRSVGTVEDRFVESFVVFVEFAHDHPWLGRLFRDEPETLLRMMRENDSALLAQGAEFVHGRLHASGPSVDCDPKTDLWFADFILRSAIGFALFPPPTVDATDSADVRAFARVTIAPLAAQWASLPRRKARRRR